MESPSTDAARAAALPRRRGVFRRLAPWAAALAAAAAGVWWMFHFSPDSLAVYRAVPARAVATLRVRDLPDRWEGLVANPVAASALRAAGVEPEDALWLVRDPETRAWFERLAGDEGILAWLPAQDGQPPALVAASWLGGDASWLRQELLLFKLPDFQRMPTAFPDRAVWRVKGLDLPPGWTLTLSFGDGVLLACLSSSPWAIRELLDAHDGTAPRLIDDGAGFAELAARDDRRNPLRLWIRDDWPAQAAPAGAGGSPLGRTIDIERLDGERMDLRGVSRDLAGWTDGSPFDTASLDRLLGGKPCITLTLRRTLLQKALRQTWLRGDFRHGVRMALEIAGDPVEIALLDGDFSGRLAFGLMRSLGLSGLKVPTLLAATPAPDPAAARAAIGRILDSCNARYRGAFVLRQKKLPGGTEICTLESAGANEWVDELAPGDRPSYALHDGWLLAASNRDALEKLLRHAPSPEAPASAATDVRTTTATLRVDLDRTATTFIHLAAMWSMARRFLGSAADPSIQAVLDDIRAWLEALRPYGQATAAWTAAPGDDLSSWSLSLGP